METFNQFDSQGTVPEKSTGDIISRSFETYKGVVLYGIVAVVLYFLVSFAIQLISGYDSAAMGAMVQAGKYNFFAIPGFSLYLSLNFVLGLLVVPLYGSLCYISHKVNTNQKVIFEDLFYCFKNNLANIIIYSVVLNIIMGIAAMLCLLPAFFVYPLFFIGLPILVFENASFSDAIKKSVNIAKENYGIFIAVSFLSIIISIAGVILCGIGIIATMGFMYTASYTMYTAYVGLPKTSTTL